MGVKSGTETAFPFSVRGLREHARLLHSATYTKQEVDREEVSLSFQERRGRGLEREGGARENLAGVVWSEEDVRGSQNRW